MKNNIHTNPLLFRMIILVTCFLLVMLYSKTYATTGLTLAAHKGAIHFQPNVEKHELTITLTKDLNTNGKY